MKHYSNFYSLENNLSANVLLDINLQLFQYLKNLTYQYIIDTNPLDTRNC